MFHTLGYKKTGLLFKFHKPAYIFVAELSYVSRYFRGSSSARKVNLKSEG
jgi:hypothetical protein